MVPVAGWLGGLGTKGRWQMAVVYSIRDWEAHFEVSQSNKVKRALSWVPLPTKHDGKSYRRLMIRTDGMQLYAAWVLIVQVAAKCPVRGVLADGDGPLEAEDLAIKTGGSVAVFSEALSVLSRSDIGWLLVDEWSGATSNPVNSGSKPLDSGSSSVLPLQDRTGHDITRQDTSSGEPGKPDSPPAVLVFPCVGSGAKEWCLTEAKLAQYRDSFPGVNVLQECRTARQWCVDNPVRRKTFTGMGAFLSRWLTKAQDRHGATTDQPNGSSGKPSEHKLREQRFYDVQTVIREVKRKTKCATAEQIESALVAAGFDPKEAYAQAPTP
jgi:hypothetical protein